MPRSTADELRDLCVPGVHIGGKIRSGLEGALHLEGGVATARRSIDSGDAMLLTIHPTDYGHRGGAGG